jgi:hypothetical protein
VVAGSVAEKAALLDDVVQVGIMNYYNSVGRSIHLRRTGLHTPESQELDLFAELYDYVLLDGRRITPTTRSRRGAGSSIIQIEFNKELYAGVVRILFRHKQNTIPLSERPVLVFVSWMVPSHDTPLDNDDFLWYDL